MIGEQLRKIRKEHGMSLNDVATKVDISVATLSRIETNKQTVELGLFVELAKILKTPPSALIDNESVDAQAQLSRRVVNLDRTERLNLWRELAVSAKRRRELARRKPQLQQIALEVDELLAHLDLLKAEVESVRNRLG